MTAPVDAAPTWRRQPYRLFFPLGLVHVWAGLVPWLYVAFGGHGHQTQVYHSIVQVQGFLVCFALGFLFTMVPRRTRTDAPTAIEMLVAVVCPVAITVCAAFEALGLSQVFWFVLVADLVLFWVRRVRRAEPQHGPLPGFVWLPIGLLMGVAGAVLFGVYGALGPDHFRIHELAQLFLLQGLFLSLVAGVGSMVFPLLTRGQPAGGIDPRADAKRAVHLLASFGLAGTFFLEVYGSHRWGYLCRGALVLALLLWAGTIWRRPSVPGANRWLVWLAAWLVPLGLLIAGALPEFRFQAGLHVTFVGGFATLAFAVAAHVSLAHGGRKPELERWSWQIVGYGALFLVAAAARVRMEFDPQGYLLWLGVAAGSFLLGTLAWAALVLPSLVTRADR